MASPGKIEWQQHGVGKDAHLDDAAQRQSMEPEKNERIEADPVYNFLVGHVETDADPGKVTIYRQRRGYQSW